MTLLICVSLKPTTFMERKPSVPRKQAEKTVPKLGFEPIVSSQDHKRNPVLNSPDFNAVGRVSLSEELCPSGPVSSLIGRFLGLSVGLTEAFVALSCLL